VILEGRVDPSTGNRTIPIDATIQLDGSARHCEVVADWSTSAGQAPIVVGTLDARHRTGATLELNVTPNLPCDLAGTVYDGDEAVDQHANPLPGVPVVLMQDGAATSFKTVTRRDGTYCLRGLGAPDFSKGTYEVRASLVDAAHDPSLFKTLHDGSTDEVAVAESLNQTDLGKDDIDIAFTGPDRPWLDDSRRDPL
jgi:hypothetical protein